MSITLTNPLVDLLTPPSLARRLAPIAPHPDLRSLQSSPSSSKTSGPFIGTVKDNEMSKTLATQLPLLCNLLPTQHRIKALGALMVEAINYTGRVGERRELVKGIMLMLKRPGKLEREEIKGIIIKAGGGKGMGEGLIIPLCLSLLNHPTAEIRILSINVLVSFSNECTEGYRGGEVRRRMEVMVWEEGNEVVRKTIVKGYSEILKR